MSSRARIRLSYTEERIVDIFWLSDTELKILKYSFKKSETYLLMISVHFYVLYS